MEPLTKGLKGSDLRPCDNCGGPLTGANERSIVFRIVEVRIAIIDQRALQQTMGLNMIFGNNALGLAEAMSPDPKIVKIAPDGPKIFLCDDCFMKDVSLPCLIEKVDDGLVADEAKG